MYLKHIQKTTTTPNLHFRKNHPITERKNSVTCAANGVSKLKRKPTFTLSEFSNYGDTFC